MKRSSMGKVAPASTARARSCRRPPLDRLQNATYADGSTVALTCDLDGRLAQVQDSVGGREWACK
ncbi:hypothetical protein [Bradyrhizobium sp.]|uniref:hypothetical protein n=1 Tax=Bradyrhizobium sp. TaxID=376 RepID=UPI003C612B2B